MIWIVCAGIAILMFSVAASGQSYSPGVAGIQEMISDKARAAGIDPAVMLAICKQESSFNPNAKNLSDPSYGLFGIKPNWLTYFGFSNDAQQLYDGPFSAALACQIVDYFQGKGFTFPDQADIYNVGETLWRQGRRNLSYRDSIKSSFRTFSA